MQAHIRNVRALGSGAYDFVGPKGETYRFIDLYDQEGGRVVRLSLSQECNLPALGELGGNVDVWAEINESEKVVRGEERDRVLRSPKLRAVDVQLAKAAAAATPVKAAA